MTLETSKPTTIMDEAPSNNDKLYAVAATYEQAVVAFNEDGTVKAEPTIITKSIYSKYDIKKNHVNRTRAVSDRDLWMYAPNADAAPSSGDLIKFNKMSSTLTLGPANGGTNVLRLYKKFIECTDVWDGSGRRVDGGEAAFNNANADFKKIIDPNTEYYLDTIKVTCPEQFKNHTIRLKYYGWNYNGTIVTKTQDVVFTQALWATTTTTNSFVVSANGDQTFTAADFSNFDFIQGKKCSNNTKWSQEAVKYTLTADAQLGAISLNMFDNAETPSLIKTLSANSSVTPLVLTQEQLEKIKNMKVMVSSTDMKPNKKYNATLTFYDNRDYVVNVVKIEVTMTLPTVVPSSFRIPTGFVGDNTYGWAGWDSRNSKATYNLASSVIIPATGFSAQQYEFKVGNDFSAEANRPYRIAELMNSGSFVVSAPAMAVKEEYIYKMTAGINHYGLRNGTLWNWNGTTDNVFNLILLSPVKYSVLGFGSKDPATLDAEHPLLLHYGNGNTEDIKSENIKAYNPSISQLTRINYLDGRDPNIVSTSLDYTNANDGNNALFSIVDNTDGSYTLRSTGTVVLQGEAKVSLTLKITDVWGITTPFDFDVTVTPN